MADQGQTQQLAAAPSQDQKEWWEELFPPAFPNGDPDAGKKEEEEMRRMFSAFDKTAIRKKFESVWNDLYGAEFANANKVPGDNSASRSTNAASGNLGGSLQHNASDSVVWNEEDLQILRKNMRALRILSRSALLELKEYSQANKVLKRSLHDAEARQQKSDEAVREAIKANERLSILVECLKKRNEELETQLSLRDADLRALIEDRNSKKSKVGEITRLNNQLQVEKRRLEFQLETVRDEHARRIEELTQKLLVERELQVTSLRQKLSILQSEFDKERVEHSVTKKALDRLSKHFVTAQSADSQSLEDDWGLESPLRKPGTSSARHQTAKQQQQQQEPKPQPRRKAVEAYFDMNELNNVHSLNELLRDLKASQS